MQSKARSGCHVATLPRRDVTTSRRRVNNAEVNNSATSRRHHVATSPRRDVTTSRRHHVATSPRRDVISKICISSFNVRTARKLGHREAYEERHGFPELEDPDMERVPGICAAFHFVRYYLGYYDDVFDTRHLVLFFHDVLDLFLGLHQTLSQTMD